MFARTPRLTLRPGWPEDAAAFARAIGHECVARMTGRVPWPYSLADAEAFLALPVDLDYPQALVFAHEPNKTSPALIGGVGLYDRGAEIELGYWLTPSAWGRGYATEAARAMLDHAQTALGRARVQAGHFVDNPGSGRVLRKLGFVATHVQPYPSVARGCDSPAQRYLLTFADAELPAAA